RAFRHASDSRSDGAAQNSGVTLGSQKIAKPSPRLPAAETDVNSHSVANQRVMVFRDVLLVPPATFYESEGRTFESFRARHFLLSSLKRNGPPAGGVCAGLAASGAVGLG